MAKATSLYTCSECSYQTIKWLGCCPDCKTFNSIELSQAPSLAFHPTVPLTNLMDVTTQPIQRMLTGIKEWDRVAGGGIVPGAFMILTGDPGIGKSTLLLHIAHELAKNYTVFYFSSEESLEQVKMRAERLSCKAPNLFFQINPILMRLLLPATSKSLMWSLSILFKTVLQVKAP